MAWMVDEYAQITGQYVPGVFTGKPVGLNGSAGREPATGQGGFYVLQEVAKKKKWKPSQVKIAVQGFGNVGSFFAYFAHDAGYKIVAVSDSRGGVYSAKGLDPRKVMEHKQKKGSVKGFSGSKDISNEALLSVDCTVLVPAALENVLTKENAASVKASVILELANGPTTPEADDIFHKNKVLVVPDVLANAGGVSVSYFEWVQNRQGYYWTEAEVLAKLEPLMKHAFAGVWQKHEQAKIPMRTAAFALAVHRLVQAIRLRGV
jgi:glutamate dehydrogenase/leucine dehydrogenase